MPLKYVALAAALLPFVAVHLSYFLSAWQGYVEWCMPYLQGCTSISGAGRHGAAYFVFKGVMIPAAVVMAIYWWFYDQWLAALGDSSRRQRQLIVTLGVVASLGLIVYCCVLGSIGDIYRVQRRIGVILYFGLTYIAQLLVTRRVFALQRSELARVSGWQLKLCLAMLVLGILNILFEIYYPHYRDVDDIFEWNFALLVTLYYLSSYWLWQRCDGRIVVSVKAFG